MKQQAKKSYERDVRDLMAASKLRRENKKRDAGR
jgi:hypothetical protein